MNKIIDIQSRLLPDLMRVLKTRHAILRHIRHSGVIGRRALAASLQMTERVLRGELDFLKGQGFLEAEQAGMRLTEAGLRLLDEMEPLAAELFGLHDLQENLRRTFGLREVVIVPGDADQSAFVKNELGRAGAAVIRKYASPNDVVAVAGGSTMAQVAEYLSPSASLKDCLFVPARGGLGETVELQANTIASMMAKRTGGEYRLLHVPDHLGEEAYQSLMQDASIREIVEVIRRARMVVHGIGDAAVMAKRRKAGEPFLRTLAERGALAEAFGYYFNAEGDIVLHIPTVGLRIEDIRRTEIVIAVAGGMSKGKAIAAVLAFGHDDVLVTDEAAARTILEAAERLRSGPENGIDGIDETGKPKRLDWES